MFSKKSTLKLSPSSKTSNELPVLISRMQKNGDQVEKDILDIEDKLRADRINQQNKRPFRYETVNSETLARSEGLLKDLFLDVDKSRKLRHPQVQEIETDVKRMHERWANQCSAYRDLYENFRLPKVENSVDWSEILAQKQREINNGGYGPQLPELERQIAAQHIMSKQLEAYGPEMNSQSITNPEELKNVQTQYKNLVDSSKARGHQLDSLYEYMQGSTKQLVFMNDQQEKIMKQDWSDRMVQPEDARKQYEIFKDNGLLTEERTVNRIQDDGDRLIKLRHPGSPAIEAHKDAVKSEWQQLLNLCICQEAHLKNVELYRKFQYDADTLSQSIKMHNVELDNKFSKYNKDNPRVVSDLLHQLEDDEKNIIQMDKEMNDLRRQSHQIAPLKSRRIPVSKPIPVVALCDWDDGQQNEISRGEKLTLQNNADPEGWVVVNSTKETKQVPGVCFNISPTDPEAIAHSNRLAKDLDDLKRKRSDTENKLKNRYNELKQSKEASPLNKSAAPVTSFDSGKDDPQSKDLLSKLNKLNDDLGETEKQIMTQLHAPVNRSAPTQDIANRLKEQESVNKRLQKIGTEKDAVQRECESHLLKKPTGPSTSQLPTKLTDVKNKHKAVTLLANQYQNKAKSQLELENSIQKADKALEKIESNLAEESVVPAAPNAMQQRKAELQRLRRELNNEQDKLQKVNQDLKRTDDSCSPLELDFQEYCPDIKKQKAVVQKLNNRYQNASDQLDLRDEMLQNADTDHQRYKTSQQGLNTWMNNLPNNQVQPTASLNEINAKLQAQKRLVDDIKKKKPEKDELVQLSHGLQSSLNDYETNNEKYRASLDPTTSSSNVKKLKIQTLQKSINDQEKDTVNRFAEVSSLNDQLLNQLEYVANVKQKQQESPMDEVIMQQNVQSDNALFARKGTDLQEQLKDETKKTKLAETTLQEQNRRLSLLRSRRPVDKTEEKEVVQYYRDPKVENQLPVLRNKIHDVRKQKQGIQDDINSTNKNITLLEDEQRNTKPGQLTKEVTQVERSPALDVEAENLRSEISILRREKQIAITDWDRLTREVTILEQKPANIKEKVVMVEKVKVEKDPGMLKASRSLQNEIDEEGQKRQSLTEKIRLIRTQIETLEKQSGKTDPKVMIKEIKKVEKDPQLEKDLVRLRTLCEEESQKNSVLDKELAELQRKYRIVADQKPKIEMKEIVRENFCVLPETEKEITKLKKEIRESAKRRGDVEMEVTIAQGDLEVLKDRKPQIQYKDITREIVKLHKSPEMLKEIDEHKRRLPEMDDGHSDSQVKIKRLKSERDEWRKEQSKIETKVVTKDVIKYEDDPMLEKEVVRLRNTVREQSEKRRDIESVVFDLQNMLTQLHRQKPEEKVVVKEMVRLEKDPKLAIEHDKLGKTLDEERKVRRTLEREVQHLKDLVQEKEAELNLEEERGIRREVENEIQHITHKIREAESAPPPVEEKIVTEEVLKVEKDPMLEKVAGVLRQQLDLERNKATNLDKEIKNVLIHLEILHKEKSQEKLICREVIRVEKDKALEEERAHARDLFLKEKNARLDVEEELRRIKDSGEKLADSLGSRSRVQAQLKQDRDGALGDKAALEEELRDLERQRDQTSHIHKEESKRLSQKHVKEKQRKQELESEVTRTEREIVKEKEKIHEREYTVRELESQISREEARHRDMQMRETNMSTKISIVDPITGEDLSPYEAYKKNMIDRQQYIHLQELECDWEEMSTHGPSGETSVLRDKKSGKQYSIEAALKDRRITNEELQLYREGKLPISEFALLVAGEDKPTPLHVGSIHSMPPISPTSSPSYKSHRNRNLQQPIAGVYDQTTNSRLSITNAMNKKLLDPITAQRLLEAQAATGGIIDVTTRERHSVHKAVDRNLVDKIHERRLLNAQKAFTGLEDPVTKERLSVGVAVQKGWLPTESAHQYLEAQYLTGGLVDPNHSGRVPITEALKSKMIDSNTARILQEDSNYAKDLTDPATKERVHYKELMSRCQKDELSGLLFLQVSSEPRQFSGYQPTSNVNARSQYSPFASMY